MRSGGKALWKQSVSIKISLPKVSSNSYFFYLILIQAFLYLTQMTDKQGDTLWTRILEGGRWNDIMNKKTMISTFCRGNISVATYASIFICVKNLTLCNSGLLWNSLSELAEVMKWISRNTFQEIHFEVERCGSF